MINLKEFAKNHPTVTGVVATLGVGGVMFGCVGTAVAAYKLGELKAQPPVTAPATRQPGAGDLISTLKPTIKATSQSVFPTVAGMLEETPQPTSTPAPTLEPTVAPVIPTEAPVRQLAEKEIGEIVTSMWATCDNNGVYTDIGLRVPADTECPVFATSNIGGISLYQVIESEDGKSRECKFKPDGTQGDRTTLSANLKGNTFSIDISQPCPQSSN
ncbi:hypothetical protein DRH14_01500 [Candidatus Shapirobacteria bacterium]|nr:MAG: hypothetical protein DRH14_01500 [Candidatus Shapirobacteria bacterium]